VDTLKTTDFSFVFAAVVCSGVLCEDQASEGACGRWMGAEGQWSMNRSFCVISVNFDLLLWKCGWGSRGSAC